MTIFLLYRRPLATWVVTRLRIFLRAYYGFQDAQMDKGENAENKIHEKCIICRMKLIFARVLFQSIRKVHTKCQCCKLCQRVKGQNVAKSCTNINASGKSCNENTI